MLAAFTTAGGVEVGEVPEPVPGQGQVLVAPLSAGICGSDLHLVDALAGLGDQAPRIVLGHEFCAEILETGPGAAGRFAPGTRVVSVPHVLGAAGPVDLGLSPELPGGFAQRAVMQESLLLRVPDGLPDDHAALTEPLAVAVHAVRAARPAPGDAALVIGCGPIGLAVIAALKADGHGPVVAADFSPARRALAERLGADVVLDPATSSPYEKWADLGVVERPPSPLLADDVPAGNVVAFECVGAPGLIQQIIEGVPRHSRIVVVGVGIAPDTITPVSAILKEVSLTFVFAYRQAEFAHALDLLASGRVEAESFVTGAVGLDGVAKAFADLHSPDEHVKIIVRPR
ncbi:zinc-binding dehydrogenase [Actinocorallia libanotica]|uniref:Zinc-binding dehydrogenase n=1 Tax=Actinocorallia libanotica TaxID=46162 RepID=A0ABP4C0M7_9ACTN